MKESDSRQILELLTRLTEELVGPVKTKTRAKRRTTLSDRVDSVSDRVDSMSVRVDQLDRKIGTSRSKQPLAGQVDSLTDKFVNLDTKVTGLDTKAGKGFDAVNRNIDVTRDNIVDVITRVHAELTNRVVDLEVPEPGRKGGGGRGSGGSGVPLAS